MSISKASFENFRQDILSGFQNIDKRFQQIDNRFQQIDERFQNLETFQDETRRIFVDVGNYMAKITADQNIVDKRVTNLERRFEYFSS